MTLVALGLRSEFMCYGWPSGDILHNGPDIDGNLTVNLSDTVLFKQGVGASCP